MPTQFGRHFWPGFSYVYGIRIDYLSPTIYTTDLLIIILFLLSVFRIKEIKINSTLFLFFAFLLSGLFFFKNVFLETYGILKIFEFSFFSIYTARVLLKKENLVKAISFPLLFESVLSIWQFLNKGSIGSIFYFLGERAFNGQTPGIANASINNQLILRPYGTLPHPNVLAGFLLLSLSLVIFSSKKLSPFYLMVLIIGTVSLFLTMSRITIFLFVLIIAFKTYRLIAERKKVFLNILFYLLILFFSLMVIFISSFSGRFLNVSFNDPSIVLRWQLIETAFKIFFKSPVIGIGLNGFLVELPNFINQQKVFFIQPVHNIYLLILSEVGIIGFSFFIFLLVKAFKNTIKRKSYLPSILLIEILILGFFDHYFLTLQQGQLLLSLVIGLSFSKLSYNEK
ncbi:MAG: hypothetical protein A2152_02575 [Candidatus Levybacteria bacterium RBG_16_35_6]|nr:MAG: hypothetical protein A2152_02575 [Candidatus Levybacteria bacterium RBG_16_35_6]